MAARLVPLAILMLGASVCYAQDETESLVLSARVMRIVDGDTLDVELDVNAAMIRRGFAMAERRFLLEFRGRC